MKNTFINKWKQSKLTILGLLVTVVVSAQCEGEATSALSGLNVRCPEHDYVLVFHDEFEEDQLDTEKWRTSASDFPPGDKIIWQGCRTSQEIFLEENVIVSGGILKIIPKKETYTHSGVAEIKISCENGKSVLYEVGDFFEEKFNFTSGMVLSKIAHSPRNHLYMESRVKIPKGVGLAPAFWTWHHDEIDIFEFSNAQRDNYFGMNYHRASAGACRENIKTDDHLSEGFHVYAVEITPWFIKWYLDDKVIRTVPKFYTTLGQIATYECGQELPAASYIRNKLFPDIDERWFAPFVNLGISTAFKEDEITGLLNPMQIDHVRIYQRLPADDEKNICYYEIKGDPAICQGEELIYTLESNEDLVGVNWIASDNLTILESAPGQIKIAIAPNVLGKEDGVIEAEIMERDAYCPDNITSTIIKLNPGIPDAFEIKENKIACVGDFGLGKYSTKPEMDVFWEVSSGSVQIHVPHGNYTLLESLNTGEFALTATAEGRCGEDRVVNRAFEAEVCEMEIIDLLSPNPADQVLTIEFGNTFSGNEFEVFIFDTNAALKFQTKTSDDRIQLDVSGYPNGLYFVQVISGNAQGYSSFVVSH